MGCLQKRRIVKYSLLCAVGLVLKQFGYSLNIFFNLFLENNEEDFHRNIQKANYKFMPNQDVLKIMNQVLFLGGSEYNYD